MRKKSTDSYLLCYFLYRSNGGHVEMATPALVVDEEAVFDATLDGLLGCLHHLCRQKTWKSKENYQQDKVQIFHRGENMQTPSHFFNSKLSIALLMQSFIPLICRTGELTQYTSAELPRRLFDQHLLGGVCERPEDEDRSRRGALHLLDPLVCQAHAVWQREQRILFCKDFQI